MIKYADLKKGIDMFEFLQDHGYHVKGNMVKCMFHDDKTPSAKVFKDHIYCFTCSKSFDVLDIYSKMAGKDSRAAALELNNMYHVFLGNDFKPKPKPKTAAQLENEFVSSIKKDFEKIDRTMTANDCMEKLMIILTRIRTPISYVSECTQMCLFDLIEGKRK